MFRNGLNKTENSEKTQKVRKFVFFQNQWTFQWGLKILKMKIRAHFCQNSLCFFKTNGLLNGKSQEMSDFLQTSNMADFPKKIFKKS